MQNHFGLLDMDVVPICIFIALDIVITLRFSINCSTSPTVLFSFKREASSETYGPRVYFSSYIFRSINQKYLAAIFYTYLYQISPLQLTMKGLTTPLSHWVHVFDCLCRCIDWGLACTSYRIDTLVL